LDIKRSAG